MHDKGLTKPDKHLALLGDLLAVLLEVLPMHNKGLTEPNKHIALLGNFLVLLGDLLVQVVHLLPVRLDFPAVLDRHVRQLLDSALQPHQSIFYFG